MIVQKISGAKPKLNGSEAAFMGISIRNKYFSNEVVEEYIHWFSRTFAQSVIFLLDLPDKYNLMVFKSLSEEEALVKAQSISDDKKLGYERIIKKLDIHNVRILQHKDYYSSPEYGLIKIRVSNAMNQFPEIRRSLNVFVEQNIGKRIDDFLATNNIVTEKERVYSIVSQYALEELNTVLYFSENGYPIEVDPTDEFPSKALVYESDEIKNFFSLKQRTHIHAHPQGRSYLLSTYG